MEGRGVKSGQCLGQTMVPPTDCHEIWAPQPPGTLTACPGLEWDYSKCTYALRYKM